MGGANDRGHSDPSGHDRCAECGEPVGAEWVSFRQDASNPNVVAQVFGGIVGSGPVGPPEKPRRRTVRDLRYPEDLGLFFHRSCAPRVSLPEEKQKEIAKLLADILLKDYRRTAERWAHVRELASSEVDIPKCRAHVVSAEGRRVFTMSRAEWGRLKTYEKRLVEIEIERTPVGGVEAATSVIAALALDRSLYTQRIELWPYNATVDPTRSDLQHYFILENLTPRRLDVPAFAERAATRDSPELREYLRDHVFIVSSDREQGRREAKTRVVERVVFMART